MKSFSIVIPALNEKTNIKNLVPEILRVINESPYNFEVIFILGNKEELIINEAYKNIHFINRKYQNFASALLQGINSSKFNYIITMDCDGSHSFSEIHKHLDYFLNNNIDIITFSRYKKSSKNNENYFNVLLSRFLNKAIAIFSPFNLSDYTNNLRIYKKSTIFKEPYISKHFEFLYEVLNKAYVENPQLKIEEFPTIHLKRRSGVSKKNHFYYITKYLYLFIKLKINK